MLSEKSPRSSLPSSTQTRLNFSSTTEMLTPSEIASLQQDKREATAYALRAFSEMRARRSKDERQQPI